MIYRYLTKFMQRDACTEVVSSLWVVSDWTKAGRYNSPQLHLSLVSPNIKEIKCLLINVKLKLMAQNI